MKYVLIILVLALAVAASVPLWGSCGLKQQYCTAWCGVRHFDSDIKAGACEARCAAERAGCLAGEGVTAVGDALDRLEQPQR